MTNKGNFYIYYHRSSVFRYIHQLLYQNEGALSSFLLPQPSSALYYADIDITEVIAGLKNTNCAFTKEKRASENAKIVGLLQNPNVCMVGANLQYDIGWLLYEYGMSTYDVKCSFVDVLQAESILDEFNIHTLDLLSHKYLKHGKVKDEIEE